MCYGHVLETRWHIRLYSLVGGSNPRPPSLQPNDMPLRHWGCPKEKVELVDHYIGVPEVRIGNLTTLTVAAPGACSAHPKLGIGNKHLSRMIIVFSWHQPMFTPSSTNCELCQASNLEQILICVFYHKMAAAMFYTTMFLSIVKPNTRLHRLHSIYKN